MKQLKQRQNKPCRLCGGKRFSHLTICYKCFRERERIKRELKIAKRKDRKRRKLEKDHNSFSYLHKKAWDLFSKYIRMKNADQKGKVLCYTCGTLKHWKEMNAGHFHHNKLDFDERNIKTQCPRCNKFLRGNLSIYGTKLAKELGIEGLRQLLLDANIKLYTCKELKQVIERYNNYDNGSQTKNRSED